MLKLHDFCNRARLRIAHDDEDLDITAMIATASAMLDGYDGLLGKCLLTQQWSVKLREFPGLATDAIRLPLWRVNSAAITYIAPGGSTLTFASTEWELVQEPELSVIMLADGRSWPSVAKRADAITITMNCGFGAAGDVPMPIKHLILTMVADFYSNRESYRSGGGSAVPAMVAPAVMLRACKRASYFWG